MSWFQHLRKRWSDWTGDREMEQQIRGYLNRNGYCGNGAKLSSVRLCAVQRPGWVQLYRFDAEARIRDDEEDDDESESVRPASDDSSLAAGRPAAVVVDRPAAVQLYGLMKDDARKNDVRIRVFEDDQDRRELFQSWAADMLQTRGGWRN